MESVKSLLNIIILTGFVLVGIGIYLAMQPAPQPVPLSYDYSSTPAAQPRATEKVGHMGSSSTIIIPANKEGWQLVGKGTFNLKVSGTINYGYAAIHNVNTDSEANPADSTAFAPGLPFGVLVGKIGENGTPFHLYSSYKHQRAENLYIAVNDSAYANNTGQYTVTIER